MKKCYAVVGCKTVCDFCRHFRLTSGGENTGLGYCDKHMRKTKQANGCDDFYCINADYSPSDDDWDEERIDRIGQNGNDGLAYKK